MPSLVVEHFMAPEHVTDTRGANAAFAITQNKIGVTPAVPPLATDHVEHRIHEAIVVMVGHDHNHVAVTLRFPGRQTTLKSFLKA